MKNPDDRKIWTALPGADYQSNWNNFNVNNVSEIRGLFEKTGNQIQEYHSKLNVSAGRENLLRCKNNFLVKDGTNNDEDKGLINFIRGEDYFDYDGDCNLDEYRTIEEKTNPSMVNITELIHNDPANPKKYWYLLLIFILL